MKLKFALMVLVISLCLLSCSDKPVINETSSEIEIAALNDETRDLVTNDKLDVKGQIFLYGEIHGNEIIRKKQVELWNEYYGQGMRHMFIESSYFTAEFLNLWMKEDNDDILNMIYNNLSGTQAHTPVTLDFYRTIKAECPETVFHGTDVGHQYNTTGQSYLSYLIKNDLKDSEAYTLTIENINQAKKYYKEDNHVYRESMMVENFIREFDKLNGQDIMGIYGGAHTDVNGNAYYDDIPSMANQLNDYYPDLIVSEDLSPLAKEIEALAVEEKIIEGKSYTITYYGQQDLRGIMDFTYRKFWRVEDAYEEFSKKTVWDLVPYDNYPMTIETGQVFLIEFGKTDGSVTYDFARSDGDIWKGKLSTSVFSLEDREEINEVLNEEMVTIMNKEYKADYYGIAPYFPTGVSHYELWHVKDAFDDLKVLEQDGSTVPVHYYPIMIEENEVYIIKYTLEDGSTMMTYVICDGEMMNGKMITKGIRVE